MNFLRNIFRLRKNERTNKVVASSVVDFDKGAFPSLISRRKMRKILIDKMNLNVNSYQFDVYRRGNYYFKRTISGMPLDFIKIKVCLRKKRIGASMYSLLDHSYRWNFPYQYYQFDDLINLSETITNYPNYHTKWDGSEKSYELVIEEMIKIINSKVILFNDKSDLRLRNKIVIHALEYLQNLSLSESFFSENILRDNLLDNRKLIKNKPNEYRELMRLLNSIGEVRTKQKDRNYTFCLLSMKVNQILYLNSSNTYQQNIKKQYCYPKD